MKRERLRKPPPLNGVGASTVTLPPGTWSTVLDFLIARFNHIEPDEWRGRMQRGEVLDERFSPLPSDSLYRPGASLFYYRRLPEEPRIPFQEHILFQDELLVVADKPHFLPVIPTGRYLHETLLVRLKRRLRIDELTPIHRIDRETAGIVVFAVRADTRPKYFELFRERRVHKEYEAIAPTLNDAWPITYRNRLAPSEHFMQMQAVAGEPNCETIVDLLETCGSRARYRLQPITGKRHQLRAHMSALGAPIENDAIYPSLRPEVRDPNALHDIYRRPLQLLAKKVSFTDPFTNTLRNFESHFRLDW